MDFEKDVVQSRFSTNFMGGSGGQADQIWSSQMFWQHRSQAIIIIIIIILGIWLRRGELIILLI
jgi:hypothetical protein